VLPSVEPETVDLTSSPRHNASGQHPVQNHNPRMLHNQVQSPKRKAFDSFADEGHSQAEQYTKRLRPVYREEAHPRAYAGGPSEFHQSQRMDPNSAPRPPPPDHIIDLTSSPYGQFSNSDRGHFTAPRLFSGADHRGYVLAPPPPHRLPPRDVRGAHHAADEPPCAYAPNARAYESRAPPARDYMPLGDRRQPPRIEEESRRYLRSGVRYG